MRDHAAGIGLRASHIAEFRALRPRVPFVEVHTENHLCGGPMRAALHDVRRDYPVSLHCVGLSIGSAHGLDEVHLRRVAQFVDEIDPLLVSDHLSVSVLDGLYTNDLLPVPYNESALTLAARHVTQVQDTLRRPILVENPSRYIAFQSDEMSEGVFLRELAARTGCSILCDVNNIYVSARNFGRDPLAELLSFPANRIGEVHIAGHLTEKDEQGTLLVDTHDRAPCDDVRRLYAVAMARFGNPPALLEWDNDLPDLDVLIETAARVDGVLDREAAHVCA